METAEKASHSYQPHPTLPNIFIHPSTHTQAEQHQLQANWSNLTRQIALTAARINNPQPHICKAIHYTLLNNTNKLLILTQRLLPLQLWNHHNLVVIAQTLRKLVSIHGPFQVNEDIIGQNQNGDVLLWISNNPARNHPDYKYPCQELTVADLATLVSKKNPVLAECLLGTRSLKEVVDGLVRVQPDHSTPHSYSQRGIESNEVLRHFDKLITSNRGMEQLSGPNKSTYRNVFGGEGEQTRGRVEGGLAMNAKKSEYFKPYRQKPVSNLSQMDRNTAFHFQPASTTTKPSSKYTQNRQGEGQTTKLGFSQKRPFPLSYGEKGKSFYRNEAPPSGPSPKTGQSFTGRGEKARVDITIINNNVNNYISNVTHQHMTGEKTPKNIPNTPKTAPFPSRNTPPSPGPHQFQPRKPPAPQSYHPLATSDTKVKQVRTSKVDTTGSFKVLQKKMSQEQMRQEKQAVLLERQDTFTEGVGHQSNYGLEEPKRKTDKLFTFAVGQEKRQQAYKHKPANSFRNSPFKTNRVSPLRQQGQNDRVSPLKPSQNPYRGSEYSPFKYTQAPTTPGKPVTVKRQTPPSPTDMTFKRYLKDLPIQQSLQKNQQRNLYPRNKTIEFCGNNLKVKTEKAIPTKSLTPQEITYTLEQVEQDESFNKTSSHEEFHVNKQKDRLIDNKEKQQPKSSLKKQLREEFKFLLGEDESQTPTLQVQEKKSPLNEAAMAQSVEIEEGSLQNKIKKKQNAFAELKKEALSLLIDL